MTVEINQIGEEAARNAELKVLQLLNGFMKFGLYISAENGITAARYVDPDLQALSSTTSSISASVVPSSSLHHAALLFSSVGVGLLAISFMATYYIKRQKIKWQRVSYEEESSSAFKKSESTSTDSEPVITSPTRESPHQPHGYTELREDDTLEITHVPPGVCFDKGFLASPSKLDTILERDDEVQESTTSSQHKSEF
jgi:hypothetical protein